VSHLEHAPRSYIPTRAARLSSVAYWYQAEPHKAFPALPSRAARQPMPAIGEVDIHRWRDAWRRANGGGATLWGDEKKE
jgi:hypothetical protein